MRPESAIRIRLHSGAALLLFTTACWAQQSRASNSDPVSAGRTRFQIRCAACHGADGKGGERAPAIGHRQHLRLRSAADIRNVIRTGIPEAGMPAFGTISDDEMNLVVAFVRSRIASASETPVPGDISAGAAYFFGEGDCSSCHMMFGTGGLKGPDLTIAGERLTLGELETALTNPEKRRNPRYSVATIRLRSGASIRGFVSNESGFDVQIQGFDNRLHLLKNSDIAEIDRDRQSAMPKVDTPPEMLQNLIAFLAKPKMASLPAATGGGLTELPDAVSWKTVVAPQDGQWPTYNGNIGGNRYSLLTEITPANVGGLVPKWTFPVPGARNLEVTPIVVGGVMYATTVNTVYALDALAGRAIWEYTRPRSKGLVGDAAGGINRGVAVLGDRVFVVTDNAHLLALHRLNGSLLWDTEMADSRQHYGSTSAPLVVNDLVISGVSGGDEGIRGFVSAYKASTGERVWRFWTVPAPGDKEAATWTGRAMEHGCAATWMTGTYDPEADLLFWPTGNPCPDFNGDERNGDNLYSDSVLALKPETGELKWHYQFTPHDLHDWDATETPMVVDAEYHGAPRKLLLQGNRNGFFYVLDRTNGKLLSATPFVKRLTWAKGIGPDGRPILADGWEPTVGGSLVCPSMDGATNWMSTAFNPDTRMFYLMALEKCNVFSKSSEWWKQGESFYGGSAREASEQTPKKYLRALDLDTGKVAWEYPQTGPGQSWAGLLSTVTGLILFGDDNGALTAVDARTGSPLWHFQLNARWKASPMTYMIDGRQHIAIAAGSSVISFALP
jgi:PQQ-dependent dehydrogenase (methanol/ethanol family)